MTFRAIESVPRTGSSAQLQYGLFNIKQADRSLEEYMEDIEKKADECGFRVKCTPSITNTMFIIGLDSSAAKRHLIHHRQEVTSAQKALQLSRDFLQSIVIERQIPHAAATSATDVHALRKEKNQPRREPLKAPCKKGCRYHPQIQCNAASIRCNRCKKFGHYAAVCTARVHALEDTEEKHNNSPGSGEEELSCDELPLFELSTRRRKERN